MLPRCPHIGYLPAGTSNSISDVAGVTVGHCTLDEGDVHTGVTVLRPHAGDLYLQRVPAGLAVINGFGKSVGLMQLEELGQIETPIALTNTFSVPVIATAQIQDCVMHHTECGRGLPTVNPLVLECNDGYLNDIQRMAVRESHYLVALAECSDSWAQGAVGAGRGMSCFGLQGGIGSASRRISMPGVGEYTVGVLVLANFGVPANLCIAGQAVGRQWAQNEPTPEKGSIILILATDAALDARQLRRLALRAGAGLARTGSVFGHGSGDIALAFSTAYTLPLMSDTPMPTVTLLHETRLDKLFQAAADSSEQAILHALWHAHGYLGRANHRRASLSERITGWPENAFEYIEKVGL